MIPRLVHAAGSVILAAAWASTLAAQDEAPPAQPDDSIEIADGEMNGTSGRLSVNIIAGDANQQAGIATIAIGEIAIAGHSLLQINDSASPHDRSTVITLGAGAFSNHNGMTSINLTAGHSNQSANLAALAIGELGAVTDQTLAQMSAPTDPLGSPAHVRQSGNDRIEIDDGALAGNNGLLQMNLVGGERNSSANTFALNISAGGEP